jgi:hypothetical protein
MTADHQTDQKHVKIKYRPREQFRSFHSRKQRWSVLVCHRRAGKTVATLNDLIRGAVNECKPEGRYAFIFPQRNHAQASVCVELFFCSRRVAQTTVMVGLDFAGREPNARPGR